MTATTETPRQQTLLVETPPELEWLGPIPLEQIRRGPWGPEPDQQFSKAIEQNGVLQPIIVEQLEPDIWLVRDGRKRVAAAEKAGHRTIPALKLLSEGRPGLVENIVTLAANARRGNPIVEFRAIEDVELAAKAAKKRVDDVAIAKATGIPLTRIKKLRQLAAVIGELRDAWEAGKFGDKVGLALTKLEPEKQRTLLPKLETEGTLTLQDVTNAKKTGVRQHQRRLPSDTWRERVERSLLAAVADIETNAGDDDQELLETVRRALELVAQHEEASA